jgi:hypothetical protein
MVLSCDQEDLNYYYYNFFKKIYIYIYNVNKSWNLVCCDFQ